LARTVTLTQLQTDIATQADVVLGSSGRYSTTQVTRFINQSIQRFRERVSDLGINRYLVSTSDYMNAGPSGVYPFGLIDLSAVSPAVVRVFGVDLEYQTVVRTLKQISFTERDQFNGPNLNSVPAAWAQYRDTQIAIFPPPDQAYFYTVWYLPLLSNLSSGSDTFDGVAGWEEFIIWDVVCRLLNKDQYAAAYGMAAAEREGRWQDVMRGATRVSWEGPTTAGRDTLLDRPTCAIPESDMFNSPTSAQEGTVALASSNGRINWYAGVEAGDRLEWTGSIWIKRRGWITLDVDTTGASDSTTIATSVANVRSTFTSARPGQYLAWPDGITYISDGSNNIFTVPANVSTGGLRELGHSRASFFGSTEPNGTKLMITGTGRVFSTRPNSVVRDIEAVYPEQVTTGTPTVYDYFIYAGTNNHNPTIERILATNPYRLIYLACDGGKIDRINGYPLSRGIVLGRCADTVRINDIHFNPNTDPYSGLLSNDIKAWVDANGRAFVLDGPEEFMMSNCFATRYEKGLAFHDEDGDGFRGVYGECTNLGIDLADQCIAIMEPNGLTLRGLSLSNAGLVPNGSTAIGVKFADTSAPASDDQRPAIYMTNVKFWASSISRAVWIVSGSYGICSYVGGSVRGNVNAAVTNASANGTASMDRVFVANGATRTSGTVTDTNALS
jgi:hypothetical protein